jgi:hypothetical protein
MNQIIPTKGSLEQVDGLTYRKQVAKTGKFIKGEQRFEFTASSLDHMVHEFDRMRANGVKVRIPAGHSNAANPSATLGEVIDLEVTDGKLYAIERFAGDTERDVALKNDQSIFVMPSYTDGEGNKYDAAIRHIAVVSNPVLPGLDGYEAIAAGEEFNLNDTITLSEESDMTFEKLSAKTGLDLNVENAEEVLVAYIEKLQANQKEEEIEEEKVATEDKEVEKAEDIKEIAASEEVISPKMFKLARTNYTLKLNDLVKSGKLTPAAKSAFEKNVMTDAMVALSLGEDDDDDKIDKFIDILDMNKPIALGEATKAQIGSIVLEDDNKRVGDGTGDALVKQIEKQQRKLAKNS